MAEFEINFSAYGAGTKLNAIKTGFVASTSVLDDYAVDAQGGLHLQSVSAGGTQPKERVLFDLGQRARLISGVLEASPSGAGLIISASDPLNYVYINRLGNGIYTGGYIGGELQLGNDWRRGSSLDYGAAGPMQVEAEIATSGACTVWLNGKKITWGGERNPSWTLHPAVLGNFAGFTKLTNNATSRLYYGRALSAGTPIVFTEQMYSERIGTTDTSGVYVSGRHTVVNATTATVHLELANGTPVTAPASIALTGTGFSGTSLAYAAEYGNSVLWAVTTVQSLSGPSYHHRARVFVYPTLPYAPTVLMLNSCIATYYYRWGGWRDLSKFGRWSTLTSGRWVPPGAPLINCSGSTAPGWCNFARVRTPQIDPLMASYCDLDSEGHPHKFPDNPAHGLQFTGPYWVPNDMLGDTVLICRNKATGAIIPTKFTFSGGGGNVVITDDGFGTGQHRIQLLGNELPSFNLRLERTFPIPPEGMTMTWRKNGDFSTSYVTDSFKNYIRALGVKWLRHLDWNLTNNSWAKDSLTLAKLNKLTQQCWNEDAGGVPIEVTVGIHNELGLNLWYTLNYGLDDEAFDHIVTYVRDHLDPSLEVVFERGNEDWNTGFNLYGLYRNDGLRRGLGKPDAIFDLSNPTINGSYPAAMGDTTWDSVGRANTVWRHDRAWAADTVVVDQGYSRDPDGVLHTPGDQRPVPGSNTAPENTGWSYVSPDPGAWYIAVQAVPSGIETAPRADGSHLYWRRWQSESQARSRVAAEQIIKDSLRIQAIFGSEFGMGKRARLAMGLWTDGIDTYSEKITWGHAWRYAQVFSPATYFVDNATNALEFNNLSVPAGEPRVNYWLDNSELEFNQSLEKYRENYFALINIVLADGGTLEEFPAVIPYEGGQHSRVTNYPNAGTDLQLKADVLAFFDHERWRRIMSDYMVRFASVSPGVITFYQMAGQTLPALATLYQRWSTGASSDDRTAPQYLGLRDGVVRLGGSYQDPLPPGSSTRRRQVPMILG